MSTINSNDTYPKQFFDTGGGAADLINPNKIEAGTLLGPVQVGTTGPVLDPTNNQITAGNISITGGGISIGGSVININQAQPYVTILGPFIVNYDSPGLNYGDGYPLFTPSVGDIIFDCTNYNLKAWTFPGTGVGIWAGINMGIISETTSSFQNAAMFSLDFHVVSGNNGAAFNNGGTINYAIPAPDNGTRLAFPYRVLTSVGANGIPRGPWLIQSSAKPFCARNIIPGGAGDAAIAGKTAIYVTVVKNLASPF